MNNKDFIDFRTDAIRIAAKFKASVDDEQSDAYVSKLFDDYKSSKTKNRLDWIEKKLAKEYKSMAKPPEWVGEPRWAYFKGSPMTFLNQFRVSHIDNKMIKTFPTGDTVFIFGSKNPPNPLAGESWSTVYKLIVQTEEGEDVFLEFNEFLA